MRYAKLAACACAACLVFALSGCAGQASESAQSADASPSESLSAQDKAESASSDAASSDSAASEEAAEDEASKEYTLAGSLDLGEIKLPTTWVRYYADGTGQGQAVYANVDAESSPVRVLTIGETDVDVDSYVETIIGQLDAAAEVVSSERSTIGDYEAAWVIAKGSGGYEGYYALKANDSMTVQVTSKMTDPAGDADMQQWLETYYCSSNGMLDETLGSQKAGDNLLGTIMVPVAWKLSAEGAVGEPHSLTYIDLEGHVRESIAGGEGGPVFVLGEFEGSLDDFKAQRANFYDATKAQEVRAEDMKFGSQDGWVLTFQAIDDDSFGSVYGISQESGKCVYILALLTDDATSFDEYVNTYEPGIGMIEGITIASE